MLVFRPQYIRHCPQQASRCLFGSLAPRSVAKLIGSTCQYELLRASSFPALSTVHQFLPQETTSKAHFRHATTSNSTRLFSTTTCLSQQQPTFESLRPPLHPATLHALTHKLKLTTPTDIQSQSYEAAITGRDVLGRARTGTGKTLAFLIPAIETALSNAASSSTPGNRRKVEILVLCPTRELASQIHSVSQLLTASHSNFDGGMKMHSQVMFGGVSKFNDVKKLEDKLPFVLVATPGRLLDHMENTVVGGVKFGDILSGISVLVLDEADRCLDMGFQKDMQRILQILERNKSKSRQTLLFSATIPTGLRTIMASSMKRDYITVDCVEDVDPATHTNANIHQSFVTLPDPKDMMVNNINDLNRLSPKGNPNNSLDVTQFRWISGLVDIIEDIIHIQNPTDYKLVVFFQTTAATQFFSHIFNNVYKIPVIEIHSKKNQGNRTSSSKLFRGLKKGILFTSDVSARGVDYPDVTHVIQYGPAEDRATYIHRLGRTGRAGKNGVGILVLNSKAEERAVVGRELKGLEIKRNKRYQDLILGEITVNEGDGGGGVNGHLNRKSINEKRLQKIHALVNSDSASTIKKHAVSVYQSKLGYFTSKMRSVGLMHKVEVVEHVNKLALHMGFSKNNLPALSSRVVGNMGLLGIRGINISNNDTRSYGMSNDISRGRGKSNKSPRKRASEKNRWEIN